MANKRVGTPATLALTKAGIPFSVHAYEHDPAQRNFGKETAAALNIDPRRLFKTLIVSVDGKLAVGVVAVAEQLDLKAFAAALGGKRAELANAAVAERSSGYVVGGISPISQRMPLRTIVDESALQFTTVYVSAGKRGLQVELAPGDLVKATRATVARIGH